jgi:hypothetical protein
MLSYVFVNAPFWCKVLLRRKVLEKLQSIELGEVADLKFESSSFSTEPCTLRILLWEPAKHLDDKEVLTHVIFWMVRVVGCRIS